ncbi:MAG: purine-nucleoside phosphorylase [Lentisphaerae bacterium]|nr:purine-nucleoside phosphorylase [Lentisphaerota bacterium]
MDTAKLEQAYDAVSSVLPSLSGGCAVVLGSGWSDVVSAFSISHSIDYADIPGMGSTQVAGHEGRLHAGACSKLPVLIFQGRRHYYEGHGWEPVAVPVYLARKMEMTTILLTNAAGGIRDDLEPGDLMVVEDHINSMGSSPLQGPHDPAWGTRFPDQSEVYDRSLRDVLRAAGEEASVTLGSGVYVATSGPSYETPAEIGMFRAAGADAVGMSTVPEATLANAAGIRVAALSCISNRAAGSGHGVLSHDEVIETTRRVMPAMTAVVSGFCRILAENEGNNEQ